MKKFLNPDMEVYGMKRIIFLGCIVLVLASMVFVSYAKMKKIVISESNLADLKGKWVGSRDFNPGQSANTDLEIVNDSLPVQGKLTFYGTPKGTDIFDFKGEINDQGNLFIKGPDIELSLYKDDGKMKLEGTFRKITGAFGTISFKKK